MLEASFYGFDMIAKFLVQNGADISMKDDRGNTALDDAIFMNHKECYEYLLSEGVKCNNEVYPVEKTH